MWTAVVRMKLDARGMEEATKRWEEQVKPQLHQTEGLAASFFATDLATGEGLSIGLWENREAALEFERSGTYGMLMRNFEDLLLAEPTRTLYEVGASDRLPFGGEALPSRGEEAAAQPTVH